MALAPLVASRRAPQHWWMMTSPAALPAGVPYTGDAGGGPIGLTVEIYLGSLGWTDISTYVYYRDLVRITQRGRPNEATTSPPQNCTMTINNRDGRFSPKNPAGPYYGLIGRNTPLRVSRMQNGVRRYRFHGEVVTWPTTWDISGSDVYAPITCTGMMRRMQQGNTPLQSVMRRGVPTDPLVAAYWPCEDNAGSTQLAAAIGTSPMGVSGTLNAAAYSAFAPSNALPTLGTDSWFGVVPSGTTGTSGRVSFLIGLPSSVSIANNTRIASIAMLGGISRIDVLYTTTPGITVNAYDTSGTQVQSNTFSVPLLGGTTRITIQWDLSGGGGSNLSWGWFVAGSNPVGAGPFTLTQLISGVSSVRIAPDGNLNGASVGHIWVQGTSSENVWSSTVLLSGVVSWMSGFNLENPVWRWIRLCAEQGVSGEISNAGLGIDYGLVGAGQQGVGTFLTLLQGAADLDLSLFYESRNQLAFALRTRVSLYNQAARLTLDYAQNQLSGPLNPVEDDAYTRNDITVTRSSGSSVNVVQSSGSLSTQPPPTGVGDYDTSVTINLDTDAHLPDQAGWRLHMGTVDEPRYPQLTLNLRHPQFTGNLGLLNGALTMDIGDRIAIVNPPPWMPPDTVSLILQGYSETLGIFEHDMTLMCSPESPYRIALLDDPVLSRADTDGSTLAAPLTAPLNSNPFFGNASGGSLAEWSAVAGSAALAGTFGATNHLPAGGPTGYGALLTPDGSLANCALQGASTPGLYVPASPNTLYQVSALVYSPGGYSHVEIGFDWYDANQNYLFTSSNSANVLAAGAWTPLSVSETSAGTAAFLRPRVGMINSPASANTLYVAVAVAWQGAVSVATSGSSSPLWTVSAGDFPFDVMVAGERMTVTGVSGSSSPQAFTVARAVNGAVKAQNAGADVRLYQPMILSL